ncbi:hypothetical protein BDA96_08G167900 [Sorghum bicolor]|uniref:Uncharacterized protein n=1 Tax=Sorghum bicolor TaxID=4558 RepID=A0A921QJE7_SORBI|nr:hypothetical protein BDA96_08G167900 [Sorghum bicolor]
MIPLVPWLGNYLTSTVTSASKPKKNKGEKRCPDA